MSDVNNITEKVESEAEKLGLSKVVTEDGKRFRAWMLTLPAHEYTQEMIQESLSGYKGYIGQKEEGEKKKNAEGQGYQHYQVYLEHDNPIRFETLKKMFPKGHLEVRRTDAATCVAYCTKEASRIGEPFFGGEIDITTYQGKRNDLEELRERILNGERANQLILEDSRALRNMQSLQHLQLLADERNIPKQREVRAHYLHGATGTGKSRSIWEMYDYDVYKLHAISVYKFGAWDQYSAHEAILLDEFRGQWGIEWMLRMMDRYPLLLPARHKDRVAGYTDVWILSNLPFEKLYEDEDKRTRAAFRRRFESIGEKMDDGSIVYERKDWKDVGENAEAR